MAALARTHSERLCKRPLGALSGGELQRVLLALALVLFVAFYPLESGLPAPESYVKYLRWFKWYNY